jgi:hypothetical protein
VIWPWGHHLSVLVRHGVDANASEDLGPFLVVGTSQFPGGLLEELPEFAVQFRFFRRTHDTLHYRIRMRAKAK